MKALLLCVTFVYFVKCSYPLALQADNDGFPMSFYSFKRNGRDALPMSWGKRNSRDAYPMSPWGRDALPMSWGKRNSRDAYPMSPWGKRNANHLPTAAWYKLGDAKNTKPAAYWVQKQGDAKNTKPAAYWVRRQEDAANTVPGSFWARRRGDGLSKQNHIM